MTLLPANSIRDFVRQLPADQLIVAHHHTWPLASFRVGSELVQRFHTRCVAEVQLSVAFRTRPMKPATHTRN